MNPHVHQRLQGCLWLLDSGVLENGCRVVRDTIHLPDHLAGGVIIGAQQQFTAADAPPDGNCKGDVRLEEQIAEMRRQREKSRGPLKTKPHDVAIELAKEFEDWKNVQDPEHFATLRRLYLTVRKAAGNKSPDTQLIASVSNGAGEQIRLATLVELLDRCQYDHDGQAEQTLRTSFYDEAGRERSLTNVLFQQLPYLRTLVQNGVNQAKLREAAERDLRETIQEQRKLQNVSLIAGVLAIAVLLILFVYRDFEHVERSQAIGQYLLDRLSNVNSGDKDKEAEFRDNIGLPQISIADKPNVTDGGLRHGMPPLRKTRPQFSKLSSEELGVPTP